MKVKCKHWNKCTDGVCCAIEKYPNPSRAVCLTFCEMNTNPISEKQRDSFFKSQGKIQSRGLGDTIKKVIDKLSGGKVKQCGGCKKRQEALNKLITYKDKGNGN